LSKYRDIPNVLVNKVIQLRVPQKSHNYMSSSEISGKDKAPTDYAVREALWVRGPQKVQNTKLWLGLFRTGVHSAARG